MSTGSTLPIDATQSVSTVLDAQLPAGPWDATITLSSGLVERTTTATITFPDSGAAPAVATQAPGFRWPYAAFVGLGVLLVAGLAVLLRAHRRPRRRGAHALTPPSGPPVPAHDPVAGSVRGS